MTVPTRPRTTTRLAASGLALGLLVAGASACGSSGGAKATGTSGSGGSGGSDGGDTKGLDPQAALARGVGALGDRHALTTTLKLDASPDELVALSQVGKDSTKLTADQARLIASADLTVTAVAPAGQTLAAAGTTKSDSAASAFVVHLDGGNLVELRKPAGGQVLFLRADAQKIASLAKQDLSGIQREASSLGPQFSFVQDALQGKWLSVDGKALTSFAQGIAGASASPDAAQVKALYAQLLGTLQKDVKATRGPASDKGDHLVLTAQSRQVVGDLTGIFSKAVPGGGAALDKVNPSDVPDKPVVLDAYVKDGAISELDLDLTQFASGQDAQDLQGKHLPLQVVFTDSAGDTSAPSGATQVDVTKLLGSLAGAFGGAAGAGGGAAGAGTATP